MIIGEKMIVRKLLIIFYANDCKYFFDYRNGDHLIVKIFSIIKIMIFGL